MELAVITDRPAGLGEVRVGELDGVGLKLVGEGVVEAVEEAEHRDHRNDLHDLRLRPVPRQFLEMLVGDGRGYQAGIAGDAECGSLGFVEQPRSLERPDGLDAVVGLAGERVSEVSGVGLAVEAAR